MASRYIYQIHKKYGGWDDFTDKIVGTFYDFGKCLTYKEFLVAEHLKELEQYKMCSCCEFNKPCFRPSKDNPNYCRHEVAIMFDENADFSIEQIEVKDWEEYNE